MNRKVSWGSAVCSIALLTSLAGTALADGIKPYTAPTIAPYTAPSIKPVTAPTIAPYTAPTIAPVTAPTIAPYVAPTVASDVAPAGAVDPSFYFHTYALSTPGAVWTIDDWANWVSTTYVAPGVPNTGGLVINPGGTYVWNSTWDNTVISGQWVPSDRSGYDLILQGGESGQDWYVGRDRTGYSQDGIGIILWNGQDLAGQYRGKLAA